MPPHVQEPSPPTTPPLDSEIPFLASDKIRIAVVGSGLAGLSTAYILSSIKRNGECPFEVHLYEKSAALGMDSASIPVPCFCRECAEEGEDVEHVEGRMDVPMRSFFPEYYTMLTGLYESLNIPYHTSDNSMTFCTLSHPPSNTYTAPSSFPHTSTTLATSSNASSTASHPAQKSYFSFSCYTLPFLDRVISLPDFLYRPTTLLRSARVAKDYIRLLVLAKSYANAGHLLTFERGQVRPDSPLYGWTMGDFLARKGFGKEFAKEAFAPLFSGLCTCSFDALMKFPAAVILEYVARNMPFGKMSFVSSSVQAVCAALSTPIHAIFLSTSVRSIHSLPVHSQKLAPITSSTPRSPPQLAIETEAGEVRHYHHVIFATQANQAAGILKESRFASGDKGLLQQVGVLDKFPYKRSLVVCHTDESVMPRERDRWRCLNFATVGGNGWVGGGAGEGETEGQESVAPESVAPEGYDPMNVSQCTHYFNVTLPQLGSSKAYLQTTNPITLPDPEKTLSASWFERATVTWDSMMAVDELEEVQGLGGRWFVGSYAWPGIPLLEGCVASGARVIGRIGEIEGVEVGVPWEKDEENAGKKNGSKESFLGALISWVLLWVWWVLGIFVELRIFRSQSGLDRAYRGRKDL